MDRRAFVKTVAALATAPIIGTIPITVAGETATPCAAFASKEIVYLEGMGRAFSDAIWYGYTTNPSKFDGMDTRFFMPMIREA